jgi:hypothetical protein
VGTQSDFLGKPNRVMGLGRVPTKLCRPPGRVDISAIKELHLVLSCVRCCRMPAFSLYITDARRASLKAEAHRLSVSEAKIIWMALDQYFAKSRPKLAIIGADGVCWADPMPLEDAERSYKLALPQYPQIQIYSLPSGVQAARGQPIPAEAEQLKVE